VGKRIKDRKRHATVDTGGRGLVLQAHPVDVQDRDGAIWLPQPSRHFFPSSNSPSPTAPTTSNGSKSPPRSPSTSSRILPRRLFDWINRNRRLAKDFEGTIASAEAFRYAASVILIRRLARSA
jgi:putative transposase